MKMLLKSNKGSGNFPPLQNIINDQHLEEFVYKSILVEIVVNMFVYYSLHYFPNTAYE
jgi:hypothetical protein